MSAAEAERRSSTALPRVLTATMGGKWPKPSTSDHSPRVKESEKLRRKSVSIFALFDKDGSGQIAVDSPRMEGNSPRETAATEHLKELLAAADDDEDGVVSLEDFTDLIISTAAEEGIDEVDAVLTEILDAGTPPGGSPGGTPSAGSGRTTPRFAMPPVAEESPPPPSPPPPPPPPPK